MSRKKRIKQAVRRYERFHEKPPERITTRTVNFPDTMLHVGRCSGILYITDEGKEFIHEFRPNSRPQLVASHDGKTLALLGGAFQFTDRGIVDR